MAAWQSETILWVVLVCFWNARSIQSARSSIGKAECALTRLPLLMCTAIMGCLFQSVLSAHLKSPAVATFSYGEGSCANR